jgi:hypothetical protein
MGKKVDLNGHTPSPLAGVSTQCPTDAEALKLWPNLIACLYPQWREGKCIRQAGSLRIRLVGCYYATTLSCPTEGVETDLVTETLVGLFDSLEALLASGRAVWRPDFYHTKKSRQEAHG